MSNKEKIDQLNVRKCILEFAISMEEKLQKHDEDYGKNGWKKSNYLFLVNRIEDELRELIEYLISKENTKENREKIKEECADIANFAMMIHDNANQES